MLQKFNMTYARVRERMDTCGRRLHAAPPRIFSTYVGYLPYVSTSNKSRSDQNIPIVSVERYVQGTDTSILSSQCDW
jgi:hypothetical protein